VKGESSESWDNELATADVIVESQESIRQLHNENPNNGYPLVMTNIANWKDPPFVMGKSTISMVIFNSYVSLPEGNLSASASRKKKTGASLRPPRGESRRNFANMYTKKDPILNADRYTIQIIHYIEHIYG